MTGPIVARRNYAGAPSARGLLLTLLGEVVLTDDGTAWTSAVLDVLGRLGVEQKAARQALMRTAAADWLSAEKVGRRTRWRLTGSAHRLLTDGAERIYSFAGAARDWDGRWLLVAVRVPEHDRRARHLIRTRLTWAGFGGLGPGLWVSPHAEREAEAIAVLTEAGVAGEANIFVATRTGVAGARPMVASAWNLAEVERRYEAFIAEFADPAPRDVLARQVELVHGWRRFPSLDPALPAALLPSRWSGLAAAAVFADRHERWAAEARLEWKRLNGA